MNSIQILPSCFRSFSALPLQGTLKTHGRNPSCLINVSEVHCGLSSMDQSPSIAMRAVSGSKSSPTSNSEKSDAKEDEKKSDTYSDDMTQAMGAALTYRHELGMNYNFICPDLIVGSCLQTPKDVDKLRSIGVKTIFCLQQNSDLEYFSVDIIAIQEYAKQYDDIEHIRAEIRDFDAFDLRTRLPAVVSKLYKAVNRNGGVTYIHCTAGLGRAPATALAFMFWVQGYKFGESNSLLQSKRSCFPKLDAITSATADILTGLAKSPVTLTWGGGNSSSVEISGLDIGWGQRIPLKLDEKRGSWVLQTELPEGYYEYKYIVDGEWTINKDELVTKINKDGHVNNYVNVLGSDPKSSSQKIRERLAGDNPTLTAEERVTIRQFLETYQDDN